MSFIRNFIDKIFNRNNIKMLGESNSEFYKSYKSPQKNRDWLLPIIGKHRSKKTQLDMDIERFLQCYYDNVNKFSNVYQSNCSSIGYSSLVRMNTNPISVMEASKNYQSELSLLKKIRESNIYNIHEQGNKQNPIFYHVYTPNYTYPPDSDIRRVYVNCNNGNIAELAQNILFFNTNPNFYMKFCANINNSRHPRGEKIVIYCNKSDISYISGLLTFTKNQRPDLFIESDKRLPFLQNLNGIASISSEPTTATYTSLLGQQIPVKKSTNSVLSALLRDSYNETVKEIARSQQNLSFLLQEPYNEILGINNFPYIKENYGDYLLNSMKAKMQLLSQKNNLYIDGLFPQSRYNNEKSNSLYDKNNYR